MRSSASRGSEDGYWNRWNWSVQHSVQDTRDHSRSVEQQGFLVYEPPSDQRNRMIDLLDRSGNAQQAADRRNSYFVELVETRWTRQTNIASLNTRIDRVSRRTIVLRDSEQRAVVTSRGPCIREIDADTLGATTSESGNDERNAHL